MNGNIKHNYEEEAFVLSELNKTAEHLESVYRSSLNTVRGIRDVWNDDSSARLIAKAEQGNEAFLGDCLELEQLIREIGMISRKMHLAEIEAKKLAED